MKRYLLTSLLVAFIILLLGGYWYLSSDQYVAQWSQSYELVETDFGYAKETDSSIGVLVYGGGKVDPLSYAYLSQLEANVFWLRFPFNLAVFGIQRGQQVIDQYPEIETWIVVGHSLGGAMGSVFSQNNPSIQGVVYLASYPVNPSDQPSLALFATLDGLLDYQDYLDRFLPGQVVLIEGGNHAGFGEYGSQAGDLEATMSPLQQRLITLDYVKQFIDSLPNR
jgi:pimeloyl-ACP methyl ester carboxylesterase